jgi:hypothetical protein
MRVHRVAGSRNFLRYAPLSPLPATASVEGRQFNGAPSLRERELARLCQ